MKEEYIWPLVGVLLGWILTSISASNNERNDRKKIIGALLTKIIRVKNQLTIAIDATEKMKDVVSSWTEYEPVRQHLMRQHFMHPEYVIDDLKKSIDEFSPLNPVLAIELESILEVLLKNKNSTLTESSKSRDLYIRFLSVYEAGLEALGKKIEKHIARIAFMHSFATYIQIKIMLIKQKRNRKKSEKFAGSLISKIHADIQKADRNSKQKDAGDAGAAV